MLLLPHRDAMRIADIINSHQFTVRQVFSCMAVQHFQLELIRVLTALTNKAGTAMMLICQNPTSDEAVGDVYLAARILYPPLPER